MQLGRYEVIRTLGEGGTAKVLLAKSSTTGQEVVLKVPIRTEADQLERLRDEARVGLRLQHPGIVETLDLFEHQNKPILVVAYVDGASLQQIRKVGPLAPSAVVRIGRQVAGALEAIHTATDERDQPLSMLHRDVTPANILVSKTGDAKLIDLGIARSAETQARATQAGAVRGTLRYLAPELIEGKRHSAATDLWALGVALWEAVLGRRAVVGDDREILTRILRGDVMKYQPGEALDPRLHDALAALIAPEGMRIQKAMAAANIFQRLEAAFGEGQKALVNAVDMALRLSPEEAAEGIGESTRQILAQEPAPVTIPPGAAPADAPHGRPVAGLEDEMAEGAPTVQMQAADIPVPQSTPGAFPTTAEGHAVVPTTDPEARPSDPGKTQAVSDDEEARVAPVSPADLNNPITGRYAKTEQSMPMVAVSIPAPADPGPMPQTTEGAALAGAARPATAAPAVDVGGPDSRVRALGINEETEASFDNPYDERAKQSEGEDSRQIMPEGISSTAATIMQPAVAHDAATRIAEKPTGPLPGHLPGQLPGPAAVPKPPATPSKPAPLRAKTPAPTAVLEAQDATKMEPSMAETREADGPPPPGPGPGGRVPSRSMTPSAAHPMAAPSQGPTGTAVDLPKVDIPDPVKPAPAPAASPEAKAIKETAYQGTPRPTGLSAPPAAAKPEPRAPEPKKPEPKKPEPKKPEPKKPEPKRVVETTAPQGTPEPAADKPMDAPPAAAEPMVFKQDTGFAAYNQPGGQVPEQAKRTAHQQPIYEEPEAQPIPLEKPKARAPQPRAQPKPQPQPRPQAQAQAQPQAQRKPQAQAQPKPQAQLKPAPQPQASPAQPPQAAGGAQGQAKLPASSPQSSTLGPDGFPMTITQAFYTKDIKDAIVSEAAAADVARSSTMEMEAAIQPVEGKIAGLIAVLVVILVLVIGVIWWAFGGDDAEVVDTPPAVVDAGPSEATAVEPAKKTEKTKKGKRKKRKRKRKRKK